MGLNRDLAVQIRRDIDTLRWSRLSYVERGEFEIALIEGGLDAAETELPYVTYRGRKARQRMRSRLIAIGVADV